MATSTVARMNCKESSACRRNVSMKLDRHRSNILNGIYESGSKGAKEICKETTGSDAVCFEEKVKNCTAQIRKNYEILWKDVKEDIEKECNFGVRIVSSFSLMLLALVKYADIL